jgi:Arc/MetJ family transcription regulator
MRTNINIDNQLINECKRLSPSLKTKKEIVDTALREFIKQLKRKKMLSLEGKVQWDGDLDEMRSI